LLSAALIPGETRCRSKAVAAGMNPTDLKRLPAQLEFADKGDHRGYPSRSTASTTALSGGSRYGLTICAGIVTLSK
jgi:hypothetical protein